MRTIQTKLPGITIRTAVAKDVPVILEFIEALADFERLRHEVEATEETLRATLFGDRPAAEVLIAEDAGQPAGFALFFANYSTFLARPGIYLEDLFVHPPFRGRGIATALITYLARLGVERGCGRLEWSVLEWNKEAIRVYESLGAAPLEEWVGQRVSGAALTALARRFDHEFAGS